MRVVSGPAAVQAATAAPQAAQTVATAAAPKPRTPAPARPAGGAPAPARKEAPAAPTGQVGRANEDLLAQVRGEQDVARQARYGGLVEKEIPNAAGTPVKQLRFAENEDPKDFYARKLEEVRRLRREGQLGPRPAGRLPAGGLALALGKEALGVAPRTERVPAGASSFDVSAAEGTPRTFRPEFAAVGSRVGTQGYAEQSDVPRPGAGGALDSVADFRQRAEQLGLRYRAAKKAMDEGAKEIEEGGFYVKSSDKPKMAAAQRQRTQEFVNARGALEQLGFEPKEMEQKFGY